jgi:hypothetical protein
VVSEGLGFLIGPFPNNAAVWEWIERNSDEGPGDMDRYSPL